MKPKLSAHARQEIRRRRIPQRVVDLVLTNPDQVVPERSGRHAYQSQVDFGRKTFLVRAIVATEADPPRVVTVYRTSKVAKYWRK